MRKVEIAYIEAVIVCPHCGSKKDFQAPGLGGAISASLEFVCLACNTVFEIYIMMPAPPARTPDTAETSIREVSYADPFTNYLYHRARNVLADVLRKLLS